MDISTLIFGGGGISGGIAGAVCFLLILWGMKSLINSALPDKILVVTGRKRVQDGKTFGFSVERGRTYNIPYFQSVSHLDLRVVPINVRVDSVNSANGITVGAHEKGKVVDANQGLDGDGPFSPTRSGNVPMGDLIELCYSGKYTKQEVRKMITTDGGLFAYMGVHEGYVIDDMAREGDEKAIFFLRAIARVCFF